jgi:hypothetical protein
MSRLEGSRWRLRWARARRLAMGNYSNKQKPEERCIQPGIGQYSAPLIKLSCPWIMVFYCKLMLQANRFLQEKPTREFLGNSTPCQFSSKQVPRPGGLLQDCPLFLRTPTGHL